MAEPEKTPPIDLGIYARRGRSRPFSAAEYIALALSILWFLAVGAVYFFARTTGAGLSFDPLNFIIVILAIFMPVALLSLIHI